MTFIVDPDSATKIVKMQQRVRWRDRIIAQKNIDQTTLVLDDGVDDSPDFSFMVIGDTGSGYHRGHNPQRKIAEQMLPHRQDCRFVLHTGDVIYMVGSSEYYPKNFIQPYREFLVGGNRPGRIKYDQMVFNQPFLPTPGNHDYYDLPWWSGAIAQAAVPFRYLIRHRLDLDIGWHGSGQGNAYAQAFLDYLKRFMTDAELERHLDQHYTAKTDAGRCLRYQPGKFTRLPNRYYTFQAGGIDFFALDSNTFNAPLPLPTGLDGEDARQALHRKRDELEQEQRSLLEEADRLDIKQPEQEEQWNDIQAKVEQLAEIIRDIDKQLNVDETSFSDREQLEWLEQRLIDSWNTESVRGRILYFHHPPYVTEATKWHQAQTLAIRLRLRQVLDAVAKAVGKTAGDRSIVDLVITGHAHCLEYLRTTKTSHADADTNWIVCGGSGFSLRRQRLEGSELLEGLGQPYSVARSQLFIGRTGQGSQKRRPYSFIRIDVEDGCPPKFTVRPYIAEWYQRKWKEYAIEPFTF
ncbi:metallophosphoesterase [Phormidium sp. CLA17]|uniref:metallophosphoesterase family protein n=1 Tax=Leptolyngbya sp. Cla-17 TaxID=2803751 RepID=UPI001490EFEE|nr:metallophosphoesterase [Leptolyngbya sp. Cla-17]MBM0742656.1 metallophosphoesterase [Leptolyngbya sp. Cla-17]